MENERSGISIVCREICKDTGEIAAYLCKKDVDNQDLFHVSIRSRANPELTYYAIRTCAAENAEYLEEVLSLLKQRRLTEKAIERYGGIVKL